MRKGSTTYSLAMPDTPRRPGRRCAPGGWTSCARTPREYSNVLTAVVMPDGHDADAFRKIVLDRYDMSLGTGLARLKGRVFRIGHLGRLQRSDADGHVGRRRDGPARCPRAASSGRGRSRNGRPRQPGAGKAESAARGRGPGGPAEAWIRPGSDVVRRQCDDQFRATPVNLCLALQVLRKPGPCRLHHRLLGLSFVPGSGGLQRSIPPSLEVGILLVGFLRSFRVSLRPASTRRLHRSYDCRSGEETE